MWNIFHDIPVEIQWKIFHNPLRSGKYSTMANAMEYDLKHHLLSCATAFAQQRNVKLTTLGRMAANDSPFFTRLADARTSFTARKYDENIQWFSDHWPADLEWPHGVARPLSVARPASAARTSSAARPAPGKAIGRGERT
jgi:hypothetical protein